MYLPPVLNLPSSELEGRGLLPPCQVACPIHQDVQKYVALISQGQFDQALRVIKETNPFPSICGLICVHDCETECRRAQVDQPLAIRALKKAAVDYGTDNTPIEIKIKHDERVAIIGAGPAGLSAAFYLTILGYKTTVFEANQLPGGIMRYGILPFRLPRDILNAEINNIKSIGVDIITNTRVDSLDKLFYKDYKAIFIATGASSTLKLGVKGEDAQRVLYAIDFLRRTNLDERVELGDHVFVIGGGSVAIEAARASLRLGAKDTHLICLEARDLTCKDKMLAQESEIKEAEEEGLIIHPCLGIAEVITEEGRVSGLKTITCTSVRDEDGRFAPKFGECHTEIMEADTVIVAIGQKLEPAVFPELDRNPGDRLKVNDITLETSRNGVFAGGDVSSGPASIVKAIASGQKAALSISSYLRGESITRPVEIAPVERLPEETIQKVKNLKRQVIPTLPADERIKNFELVETGYSREASIREANRCLSCGVGAKITNTDKCAACLTCVRCCPYGAASNSKGDIEINTERCLACGLCVTVCPARAIDLDTPGFEDIEQGIKAALEKSGNGSPAVLGIFCSYSVMTSLPSKSDYHGVNWLRVPCLSRVATRHLLKAFELGASGVFIIGCTNEDCRYQDAIGWAGLKIAEARMILSQAGLDEECLKLYKPARTDSRALNKIVTGFIKDLSKSRTNITEGGS